MRSLPDDNLAYPIKITFAAGGSGTGFFLNTDDAIYIATAKHVLYDPKKGTPLGDKFTIFAQPKDQNEQEYSEFHVDFKLMLLQKDNVKVSETSDVVIVKFLDRKTTKFYKGITVKKLAKSGIIGVPLKNIKKFDEVLVGNDIFVMGYPSSIGLKQIPQIEYDRPLLRKGIIAGKNEQRETIILDAEVYPGNSGGPVIQVTHTNLTNRHYSVVGVVSQYVPFAHTTASSKDHVINNSSYSVATPMDPILELL